MRKVVTGFATSLDGYIEGPHGEYDWIVVDKEMDFAEMASRYDTYLYGRKSYEAVRAMGQPPSPKAAHYVFSTSLPEVAEGFTLVKEHVREAVLALKAQPGKDIAVYGGASLLSSLLDLELVDELSLSIIPVVLGGGKPMVTSLAHQVWLTLSGTRTYANGTVQLTYSVRKRH